MYYRHENASRICLAVFPTHTLLEFWWIRGIYEHTVVDILLLMPELPILNVVELSVKYAIQNFISYDNGKRETLH